MPKQILFIQGAGASAHDQWDSKLVDSLRHELGGAYTVLYPRMPDEADPSFPVWKTALSNAFDSLGDGAILIGHSVGAAILLHTLAEEPPKFRPGALILIAPPFIGDGGWRSDDIAARADFSRNLPPALPVLLYHGTEDDIVPPAHAGLYAKAIPDAVVRSLPHRDHQLDNDLSEIAQDIRSLASHERQA
jgi:hypothetical protein